MTQLQERIRKRLEKEKNPSKPFKEVRADWKWWWAVKQKQIPNDNPTKYNKMKKLQNEDKFSNNKSKQEYYFYSSLADGYYTENKGWRTK